MHQLDGLLVNEEAFWKQRPQVSWLREGDRNTWFFHQKASGRKQRNKILRLRDGNGNWCDTGRGIEGIVLDYFDNLFPSTYAGNDGEVFAAVETRVTSTMNETSLSAEL